MSWFDININLLLTLFFIIRLALPVFSNSDVHFGIKEDVLKHNMVKYYGIQAIVIAKKAPGLLFFEIDEKKRETLNLKLKNPIFGQ